MNRSRLINKYLCCRSGENKKAYNEQRNHCVKVVRWFLDRIIETNKQLDLVVGVAQGFILEPLLLNIFLCDMFLFCNDIDFSNYADNNTPYCIVKTPGEVITQLKKSSNTIFEWFKNSGM